MRYTKLLLAAASLMPSAAALAHSSLNPIAPMLVAGNGGLAWFQFVALNVLPIVP